MLKDISNDRYILKKEKQLYVVLTIIVRTNILLFNEDKADNVKTISHNKND